MQSEDTERWSDAFKYQLLQFLNGYAPSSKHMDAIEQGVDIIFEQKFEQFKTKMRDHEEELNRLKLELQADVRKEIHKLELVDSEMRQQFKTIAMIAKVVIPAVLTVISGILVWVITKE